VTVILPDDLPDDAASDPAFSIPDLAQDIGLEDLSRGSASSVIGVGRVEQGSAGH
jgi:hypothetical protein